MCSFIWFIKKIIEDAKLAFLMGYKLWEIWQVENGYNGFCAWLQIKYYIYNKNLLILQILLITLNLNKFLFRYFHHFNTKFYLANAKISDLQQYHHLQMWLYSYCYLCEIISNIFSGNYFFLLKNWTYFRYNM